MFASVLGKPKRAKKPSASSESKTPAKKRKVAVSDPPTKKKPLAPRHVVDNANLHRSIGVAMTFAHEEEEEWINAVFLVSTLNSSMVRGLKFSKKWASDPRVIWSQMHPSDRKRPKLTLGPLKKIPKNPYDAIVAFVLGWIEADINLDRKRATDLFDMARERIASFDPPTFTKAHKVTAKTLREMLFVTHYVLCAREWSGNMRAPIPQVVDTYINSLFQLGFVKSEVQAANPELFVEVVCCSLLCRPRGMAYVMCYRPLVSIPKKLNAVQASHLFYLHALWRKLCTIRSSS